MVVLLRLDGTVVFRRRLGGKGRENDMQMIDALRFGKRPSCITGLHWLAGLCVYCNFMFQTRGVILDADEIRCR